MEVGTSYFGVRDVNHATTDLDRFTDAGLNAVLHTFSERDQRYYADTMADIVSASHDRGFTVYVNPWAVGRVFGGEALSEFIGKHPDARQLLSTGQRIPAACFNNPMFREFMYEWTADAAGLGADVLFWDEPHWFIAEWYDEEFPDDAWACRCEHCQSKYEEKYGEAMPTAQTEHVNEFRESSLLDFLSAMMERTHEEGAENAVCLLPGEDSEHGLSDWEHLAANAYLDVLATDPYWDVHQTTDDAETFVGYFADRVADIASDYDKRSQIWVQGFRLAGDDETIDDVRTATQTIVDSGVDSAFMWGYDGCRTISSISCEKPEAVWNAYIESLPSR
jgi:hypothetical protein